MTDSPPINKPSEITDGDPMKERLTDPQLEALNQIFELNLVYPLSVGSLHSS